jgi:hypothetical protein
MHVCNGERRSGLIATMITLAIAKSLQLRMEEAEARVYRAVDKGQSNE